MKKADIPIDEKFENQDFDLFNALAALDKKDYGYYDRLTQEQQRKFVPYMMLMWMSAVKGNKDLQNYYVSSTDYYANKHMFNENVQKHPKLQWLMLCAASPGIGKQFHQWIPNISSNISKLKTAAKVKDIKDYYAKIYPKLNKDDLQEMATEFVENQKRKMYLSQVYPNIKIEDVEVLNQLITDMDIEQYEKDRGNG
jgi:hypothetical protein